MSNTNNWLFSSHLKSKTSKTNVEINYNRKFVLLVCRAKCYYFTKQVTSNSKQVIQKYYNKYKYLFLFIVNIV